MAEKVEKQSSEIDIVWEEEKEIKKKILVLENQENYVANAVEAGWGEKERKRYLEDETEKEFQNEEAKCIGIRYEPAAEDRNIIDDLTTDMTKENVKLLETVVVGALLLNLTFYSSLSTMSCNSLKNQFETPQQVDQTSCSLFILTKVLSK